MNELSLRRAATDPFEVLAGVLFFGYMLMSRTFAHWGIPPLYVGEAALGAYFVAKPASLLRPWIGSMAVPSKLSGVSWWLAVSLVFGAIELMYGLLETGFKVRTAEIYAFHIYPLYFFPGVWVGLRHPHLLPRLIRILAWVHGIYGTLYIVVLSPLGLAAALETPEATGIFGHPVGTPVVLLGLLVFERNLWRAAVPLMLNMFIMLAMQRRAEWLCFIVAIVVWSVLAGRVRRLLMYSAVLLIPLVIGMLPGVRFPTPGLRGESTTTADLLGRALSAIDPSLAEGLTEKADDYGATASWRTDFWNGIWHQVHATPGRAIFGLGFDYPLWQLHPLPLEDDPVRTPHNIFMFVLGYSGWLGVAVFAGLQFSIARLQWRTYCETGEPFGLALWALVISWALFDPLLETPFHAIPLYLLLGLAAVQRPAPETTEGPLSVRT